MPFKKFWNLSPDNHDESVLNMYVYGQIQSSASFFGSEDDVVSGEFVRDLNRYPGIGVINVYINSPGGSVFAAAAIRNQLRKHEAVVQTWCDGICASAAVGLLLAADPGHRHMSKATLMMIHNPSTKVTGEEKDMLKAASLLAKVKQTILDIYIEGTGLSAEQLTAMMDDETYLTATEAKAYNFIDSITEESEAVYNLSNDNKLTCRGVTMDVAACANMEALKAHLQVISNNTKGGKKMKFDEFVNSLTAEQQALIKEEMKAQLATALSAETTVLNTAHNTVVEALKVQNSTLTAANDELRGRVTALESASNKGAEDPYKDLAPEVRNIINQAKKDAADALMALTTMKEEKEFSDFKETFNEFGNLPIQDAHIKAMRTLAKEDAGMYNEMRELLKVANASMATGFTTKGSNGGTDVGTSAYDIIDQKISAYREANPTADYNEAFQAVINSDPGLYGNYREEMSL